MSREKARIKVEKGQVFGDWTVTIPFHTEKKSHVWYHKCQCMCGNEAVVHGHNLRTGKSTKCIDCRSLAREKGSLHSAKNHYFSKYVCGARNRNLKFDLTFDQFISIITRPCNYCGMEDSVTNYTAHKVIERRKGFKSNGIDRVDNNLGYTTDNCVPCCKICNSMKMTLSYDNFIAHINRIASHVLPSNDLDVKYEPSLKTKIS
jgi:hypothetical protein